MGRTACTESQCLYSRAIPLLPLWAVRPVQSLSACTRVRFTFFLPMFWAHLKLFLHKYGHKFVSHWIPLLQSSTTSSDPNRLNISVFELWMVGWTDQDRIPCSIYGLWGGGGGEIIHKNFYWVYIPRSCVVLFCTGWRNTRLNLEMDATQSNSPRWESS